MNTTNISRDLNQAMYQDCDGKICFYGFPVSDYGMSNNRLDYFTLSRAFPCIYNDRIMNVVEDWDIVLGPNDDEELAEIESSIVQTFIIDQHGYEVLKDMGVNDLVYYSESANIYIWCITHYGTSWQYVLTDIKLDLNKD